ncbi:MAG: pyridoxal phosphate-dependent aminotransferase family protein [Cytophagales bacterium]|nr:MAG: pyridoxal phosphate-dependent aminotransferase family protein [Cytophagales bacterium]TAF61263.1 MAG: pyridoxal phosphate-dependent aminotransferase family protein [Cytophagales bacterium]
MFSDKHNREIYERLHSKLQKRKEIGIYRELQVSKGLVDFCSNDYLGLARNRELYLLVQKELAFLAEDLPSGSTGSRLLTGNHDYNMELENKFADLFEAEASLIFNSGYVANTALMSCVADRTDTIIYDELIHASIKEGYRLSFAKRYPFAHNDLNDLEKKLNKAEGEKFVVVESVYSMDGDAAPLQAIAKLCDDYNANLILDEAHSTGLWGKGGSGIACQLNIEDAFFARIYTFGKAIGSHGACVVGNQVLKDYLINFAQGLIYTTALPIHTLVSVSNAFDYLAENMHLQQKMHQVVTKFGQAVQNSRYDVVPNESPIQVIKVRDAKKAKDLAYKLQRNGLDVRAIVSPTVRAGEERLRICLHVYNTDSDIDHLASLIG